MKFYRDLFEASLNHVVPEHDKQRFSQAFYSTSIHMSPETERYFSQRSGEEGQQMIFRSFFAMLATNGDLFMPDFLEQLAHEQSEEGLRLPPRFFTLWREAMLKTVRANDPLCDREIFATQAMAIAPGLEYLRRQAEFHCQTVGQQPYIPLTIPISTSYPQRW